MKFKDFLSVVIWIALVEATIEFFHEIFNASLDNFHFTMVLFPFFNFVSYPVYYLVIACITWPLYRYFQTKRQIGKNY